MKLLSSVAVATIFTLLGRTVQMTATARFSNGGQDVTSAVSWGEL